jgi:hypothetical protein
MFGNYNKDYVFEDKEDAANSNEIIEKSKNSINPIKFNS